MKKLFALAIAGIVAMSAMAQQKKISDLIKFNEEVHSFGKIKQGNPVTYDFTFTNISKEPVVIERAQASCGCTTPKWPQEAIMPGKTGVINVGYNAASVAPFEKSISVKVAGVEDMLNLKITGEVLEAGAWESEVKAKEVAKAKEAPAKQPSAPSTKKSKPAVKKTIAPAKKS
jgi:hypothetical protein